MTSWDLWWRSRTSCQARQACLSATLHEWIQGNLHAANACMDSQHDKGRLSSALEKQRGVLSLNAFWSRRNFKHDTVNIYPTPNISKSSIHCPNALDKCRDAVSCCHAPIQLLPCSSCWAPQVSDLGLTSYAAKTGKVWSMAAWPWLFWMDELHGSDIQTYSSDGP